MRHIGNIDVKSLTLGFRRFGFVKPIVEDFSLKCESGSFTSIIGSSGCGKSTLLNAIGGHYRPLSGQILLDGCEITGPAAELGIVFQQHTLFPWKTVVENVRFGPMQRGVSKEEANRIAGRYIEMVGLSGYDDYYPKMLSGGMQHRAEIARALANAPSVLLMDEPFGALDAQMRATLQNSLMEIWRETKVTVIFVTHDVEEAMYLSQKIVVMSRDRGKICEAISVDDPFPRSKERLFTSQYGCTLKERCIASLGM
ncbi:ABC transporter ATP-binding protein [Acidiferrobacter sp. SPIII_3]|jgi:NitT/TauT family transport system ATP-binding protein|uniref:ABC transporter ATP-binding protein n=1 Tax=Acidiferrobacter sp. SPIII_3 TaxID=1281578 RepID=UPI000D729980|nr:ABC transporter ATP-binding protein [Acidiferrobacter sp. SPIII_3]AWP22099.1 ABC transporter ATP-binding protein [Acidiferrobacter sp. SPIII_3]MDA8190726.1 ABC transporter ATP-binding protein [Gammaproteobacteria bacterium]